jgi:hypothetical protein
MSFFAAAALIIWVQSSGAVEGQTTPSAMVPSAPPAATSSVPTAGTEAALRSLVAGLASGSPDYDKLSPQFAEVVRRDLPMTHRMFSSLGELKSVTFRGRGARGDDAYNLVFANGGVIMSAALDAEGRMAGGILQPVGPSAPPAAPSSVPTAGTEAALRRLVAGLASGSPDYDKLSPRFAEVVRRDLPRTQPLFSAMGELRSVTFRGRGERGDDVYNLVFANGGVMMSAALDADGRMLGGILQPVGTPAPPAAPSSVPAAGTEAALRRLVAGLASGSPDYDRLSPQFAEIVRRDLPMTHAMFGGMGDLQSVTFRGRGASGDDVYDLVFANGGVTMSAALDADGRMAGGILRPAGPPGR